jgi:hypothetical protein
MCSFDHSTAGAFTLQKSKQSCFLPNTIAGTISLPDPLREREGADQAVILQDWISGAMEA